MFNNRKLWLLIIFSINNQELFGMEKLPKKSKRKPSSSLILAGILKEAERTTTAQILEQAERKTNEMIAAQEEEEELTEIEAKKVEQEAAQKAQEEEEELKKLQEWIDAPLNRSFGNITAEELLQLQRAFAGIPDNSTNPSGSLSQMTAQNVLSSQQEREAQAAEAAARQAEQQRIEAERTEQSKREAAQKEAALQVEKEQRERAARIKLYQQKQAAEEEAKRAQEAEKKRSFYDKKHRKSVIEDLRNEVIRNKIMGPQDALQEIQRVFNTLLDYANNRNDQDLLDKINSDRQVLIDELFATQLEREQNSQAAAVSAKKASNIVTLADVKNRFAQMVGGQPSSAKGDDQIVISGLTETDFLTMNSEQLGRLINQQDMKKTEASEDWVIGRVGDVQQHPNYPYIFQRIVSVQYGANCGYHAMAHGFNIANNHLLGNPLETVSDQGLFIQKHQMINDEDIEENWGKFYSNSTNQENTPIPLAIVTDKLEPMGQLGIQKISFPHLSTEEFLINTIKKEIEKDGRRAFVIVANTSSKGVHWYGLVILKHEDGNLQFVFVDSAGMTTENVGNGNVANATHLREDHRSSQNIYQLIKRLMNQ